MKILLVDDHPAFRAGVAAVLRRDAFELAEAGTVAAALECARDVVFDLVIVDLVLPERGGLELVRELRAVQPLGRILILSMIDDSIRVAEALRAGVNGYALKSQPVDEMLEAVRTVLAGERYVAPGFSEIGTQPLPLDQLTPRERMVFALLVQGLSSRAVAEELVVARRTVDEHRRRIMQKLDAHSIVDLLRIARRCGVLEANK